MENTARDYSAELGEARSQSNENLSNVGQLQSPGQFNVSQNSQADNYGNVSNHVNRLAEARQKDEQSTTNNGSEFENGKVRNIRDALNTAKSVADSATPAGAVSLFKQIDFMGDMPFIAAGGAAIAKDLIDLISAPTIILPFLFSAFCSIFIFMMLLLENANSKKKMARNILKKAGILIGGGVADSLPGIDFLPIETFVLIFIYYLTLVERRDSQEKE